MHCRCQLRVSRDVFRVRVLSMRTHLPNQDVARGRFLPKNALEVRNCGKKGLGLFTRQAIPWDTLIIEYVGNRVPAPILARPGFDKSYVVQSKDGMIDGSWCGNESRFINHSCNPNLVLQDWQVRGLSRVVFKSRLFIPKDTELTFSYNRDGDDVCLCGASICKGRFK